MQIGNMQIGNMQTKNIIYLDNAATTRVRKEAVLAMEPYFSQYYGNPSSSYEFGMISDNVMETGRKVLSEVIHCNPDEIYYTSGGTESDNWAITGSAFANYEKGNHIITSKIEHPAVKNACEYLKSFGFDISYIDVDNKGMIRLDQLERAIRKETTLISVMTANNEIGTIQPIEEIGRIARKHQILFHTDAVQAFCHIPIDVRKAGIDMLSVSSHKFGGPKGVGFLYIKKGTEILPFMNGGHQENNMRAGTGNVPGVAGMTEAAGYVSENLGNLMRYEIMLRNYMIRRIFQEIPFCRLNGHESKRLPGNINISFEYADGGALLGLLDLRGICVSTGSACSAKTSTPSEVLKAIGLSDEMAHSSIRISLSALNTREEIDYVIQSLKEDVQELRQKSSKYQEKMEMRRKMH